MPRPIKHLNRIILAALIMVALASSLLSAATNTGGFTAAWWSEWLQDLSSELLGALATFGLFELFLGRLRSKADEPGLNARKKLLLEQVGSPDNRVSAQAVDALRENGWLDLQGVDLSAASLTRHNMSMANLQHAVLRKASLQATNLFAANAERADLAGSDLRDANLYRANLRGANLANANLTGANLYRTNLRAANLSQADLGGADLEDAQFDDHTVLPDGRQWTPEADMARFTDPAHPDFWRPD